MKDNTESIRQILSRNIKKRREYLGLTQEKLAENTGLSVQTINTIEGCRMWISDKSITKLAKALDVEIFQLLMPNYININNLDDEKKEFLLELWQRTKLIVQNIDEKIDTEFNNIIKYFNYKHTDKI